MAENRQVQQSSTKEEGVEGAAHGAGIRLQSLLLHQNYLVKAAPAGEAEVAAGTHFRHLEIPLPAAVNLPSPEIQFAAVAGKALVAGQETRWAAGPCPDRNPAGTGQDCPGIQLASDTGSQADHHPIAEPFCGMGGTVKVTVRVKDASVLVHGNPIAWGTRKL